MKMKIGIKNQSIETSGLTKDYRKALCEYVWNALEANAAEVSVAISLNPCGGIEEITVSDNGNGVDYNDLSNTFGTFLTSKKNETSVRVKSKKNRGSGRFSFLIFASSAKWNTIYKSGDEYREYEIVINDATRDTLEYSEPIASDKSQTGTIVRFSDIQDRATDCMQEDLLEEAFQREFAWYLCLYKEKNIKIYINGNQIDYKKHINDEFSKTVNEKLGNDTFTIRLTVWDTLISEKSYIYYMNSENTVIGRKATSHNKNGMGLHHSVFVASDFFDDVQDFSSLLEKQQSLFISELKKEIFWELEDCIEYYLQEMLELFKDQAAENAVHAMKMRNSFPQFEGEFAEIQEKHFAKIVKEIYKFENKIFLNLNSTQECTLLGFLNLLLSSDERDNIYTIMTQIVKLTPAERDTFKELLTRTELDNIIDTVKFINDRESIVEGMKKLVYQQKRDTNERNHIQKVIEEHFWLFGEQYQLASADRDMQKALEGYTDILYGGEKSAPDLSPDADKERRMDIFLCQSMMDYGCDDESRYETNIILELKAPKVKLSKKTIRQIEDYMDYIMKRDEFRSQYREWKFIAVSDSMDSEVRNLLRARGEGGRRGLVTKVENYEIYVFTWNDIFTSFEIRYKALLQRLNLNKERLAKEVFAEAEKKEGRAKSDALTDIMTKRITGLN